MKPYGEVVGLHGPIQPRVPTPEASITFKRGDWVRIRMVEEISATLNVNGKNRGLHFDVEMAPY